MAYDQHNAYEPPRRQYMGRTQPPPAPAHNQYNTYAEYASTPFDGYEQGYSQGHGQQNGGYGGYEQEQDHGYSNGYNDGYSRHQQAEPYYDHNQDRQYDPRYQPRAQAAQRGPPPAKGPPAHQWMPPPRDPYQHDVRNPESHRGQNIQSRPPREQYDQSNGYSQREQYGHHGNYDGVPQQAYAPAPAPTKAPGKLSMDEWKAQERAKMKDGSKSPQTLPFDNAFPIFGNKNGRPESGQSKDEGNCGSREHSARPRTANTQASPERLANGFDKAQSGMHRPDLDRHHSFPEAEGHDGRHHQYEQGRSSYEQQPSRSHRPLATPDEQQYPDTWPMISGQTPPKSQHAPPQDNGYRSDMPYHEETAARPREPPIDTSHRQAPQSNSYSQPLSPVHATPRPTTSAAMRPHVLDQINDSYNDALQKPWMQTDGSRPESVRDILDDYGAHAVQPGPPKRATTTREEEIENEMPDFDSARPDQTSEVHQRMQNLALNGSSQGAPRPPMQMGNGMPQSSSLPDVRYDERGYPPNNRPPPGNPRGPPPNGRGRGAPPGQQYGPRGPYGHPPRGDPRMQQGGPMQPLRAPYNNEPPVRRSLDDGRPMPRSRNGPPPPGQQRFYGNGPPPPRGGYGPRRPGLDRMGTGATTFSDPGQQRAGTAPPQRQGMMSPLGMHPDGRPALSQQRSAPEGQMPPGNPDALPRHPVPVRPGLMEQGQPQPAKPPPIRNHNGPPPSQAEHAHQRQPSLDAFAQPVTHEELNRLRASVDAGNSPKQTLILVQKLVEAASVLASEGGRVDPKTTAKNRENWIMEAHKRLKRIVQNGYPDAQFYMADCYGQGMLGLEPDTKEAFKLYQAAAKGGHAESAYRTAVCCEMGAEEGGGTNRDYPKAVQWYRRAAALGNGPAMYKLGAIMLKGLLGQQRNIAEAVNWLKRGVEKADSDHPHALHELAQLYESSNTNPEIRNKIIADDSYALELYQQAAGLGYKFSQFRLGQAHEYGQLGLPIDNRSSIAYYTKAAAQGEHQAELALSGWYLTGAEGILEHSDTEAYLWARKAAGSEPPLAKAMFAMGYFTENGIGCPKSLDEAKKWYGRAASYKFPKALERLEELRKGGNKNSKVAPANGKLTRKDQKKDEENCVVM